MANFGGYGFSSDIWKGGSDKSGVSVSDAFTNPAFKDFYKNYKPSGEDSKRDTKYQDEAKRQLGREFLSKKLFGSGSSGNLPGFAQFGDPTKGMSGEVFPGFGAIQAQQHAPLVVHDPYGGGGKGSRFAGAGNLAGLLGTAAGVFGPLGAPIGAAVGGLIDEFV